MGLKDKVLSEGMKLASHPALTSLLQDERFMKLVMQALSVPGRIDELTAEQKANVRAFFELPSRQEVDDLKRSVRSLEEDNSRLRSRIDELEQGA